MTFAYEEVSDDDRKELDFVEGSLCAIEWDFQWSEFQSVVQELTEREMKPVLLGRLTPTRFGGGGKGRDSSRPRLRQNLVLRACLRLPLPQKGFRKVWRTYGRGHFARICLRQANRRRFDGAEDQRLLL